MPLLIARRSSPLPVVLIRIFITVFLAIASRAGAVDVAEGEQQDASGAHAIIAGQEATASRPWMAALVRRTTSSTTRMIDRQFCGGVLIAPSWVLTAAHCVEGRTTTGYQVVLGQRDLTSATLPTLEVSEHVIHPFYDGRRMESDLALVRLEAPTTIQPVLLATEDMDAAAIGRELLAIGWGSTAWDSSRTCTMHFIDSVVQANFSCKSFVYDPSTQLAKLQQTSLVYQTYQDCDARYKRILDEKRIAYGSGAIFSATATSDIICAWDSDDSSTPCYGDSGGPVVRSVDGTERVFGITSFGMQSACRLSNQIGIYTRVSSYDAFIDYTMNRTRALGHDMLCPGALAPVVSYAARSDGKKDVTLSWRADARAEGYRVFYAPQQGLGLNMKRLELPAGATELNVALASGVKFFVAVQGKSTLCDGPLSSLVSVDVP